MLDLKFICDHPEEVKKNLSERGEKPALLDAILKLNETRKKLIFESETLRAKQNTVSKEIVKLKQEKKDAAKWLADMKEVSGKIKDLQGQLTQVEESLKSKLLTLPNLTHTSVPVGKTPKDNPVIRVWEKPPKFNFLPKDHQTLGENLGILEMVRASKISGARFSLLKGLGAKLERALINFMLDLNTKESHYEEVFPPLMVNAKAMCGTGQLPKFETDLFKVQNTDYFLIPTAEVPLTNLYRDEILEKSQLPIRLTAYTPCFRSEAGSHGKDVRGLIRQHQFNKVEIVKVVDPATSYDELETLTLDAEKILQKLELPYRVVLLCTADTGFGASKTYDIEVWLPSQNTYREISSCSNFEDFQARRMNLRYRENSKAKPTFPHTLNGSALAVGRTWLAILENFQNEDGSIRIPKVLQSYVGSDVIRDRPD